MKKTHLLCLITALFAESIFALPGFRPSIPDNSGDYVFYKDNSFERESYIGFLRYDEGTYQLKYYAPEYKDDYLAEKEMAILFTMNPDADYVELTGERILSAVLPDTQDADLVNYLHDMLYELTARRSKVYEEVSPQNENYKSSNDFWSNGISLYQDYPQFGGDVVMTYDCIIPLFNLKSISDMEGKELFTCVTFGTLTSSSDKSFDDFKGFSSDAGTRNQNKSGRKLFKPSKKASEIIYQLDDKKIVLDSDWSQSMDNLWLLGDAALLSASAIPATTQMSSILYNQFILRRLISSGQDSYTNLKTLSVVSKNGNITLNILVSQPKNGNTMRSIKSVSENANGTFTLLLFTSFEEEYAANKKYFDKLISKNL